MEDRLMAQLKAALSEEEYIALLERFAGVRLYISAKPAGILPKAIGLDAAQRLKEAFGQATIRVPLDRETLVKHYAANGMSAASIARRLGLTENGVGKIAERHGIRFSADRKKARRLGGAKSASLAPSKPQIVVVVDPAASAEASNEADYE